MEDGKSMEESGGRDRGGRTSVDHLSSPHVTSLSVYVCILHLHKGDLIFNKV